VTWNAGEGSFTNDGNKTRTITLPYGSTGDFTLIAEDVTKPSDHINTYKVIYWEDQNKNKYSLTNAKYSVLGDITFTAVYGPDQGVSYTVKLDAAGGMFSDGEITKTYQGSYGDSTNINVADPVRSTTASAYYYIFEGWSTVLPKTFAETVTITAKWKQVYYEFVVNFDPMAALLPTAPRE
jgi:hypothetical protein